MNPDCECRSVILQFVTRERERDGPLLTPKTAPAMYYDYKARAYDEAQAPEKNQPSLDTLIAAVRRRWPGFEGEVRRRHRRLKALLKRARRDYPDAPAEPLPAQSAEASAPPRGAEARPTLRVGRNDPCPCGSGRKYKKCCGR